MQLDMGLGVDEEVVALIVRTADGRLEVREVPVPVAAGIAQLSGAPLSLPRTFTLEWVKVRLGFVEIRRGAIEESLPIDHVVVPQNWPRDVEVAATAYIGPAGTLVLDEPRCSVCKGKGTSPLAPPGWTGGTCPICDGTGEYVVQVAPSADDAPLPEDPAP